MILLDRQRIVLLRGRWLLFDNARGPSSQVPNPNSKTPTNPSSDVPTNASSEVQAHKSHPSAQRSQLTSPSSQVPMQKIPARPNSQAPCHGPWLRICTARFIFAQMPKLTNPSSCQVTGPNSETPTQKSRNPTSAVLGRVHCVRKRFVAFCSSRTHTGDGDHGRSWHGWSSASPCTPSHAPPALCTARGASGRRLSWQGRRE